MEPRTKLQDVIAGAEETDTELFERHTKGRSWRFTPAQLNGQPVKWVGTLQFYFSLPHFN